MRFAFDFVVRLAGSQIIEADSLSEAKAELEELITRRSGSGLIDFEIVRTRFGPLAAMNELDDLKHAIINRVHYNK